MRNIVKICFFFTFFFLAAGCLMCTEGQCPSTKPIPEFYKAKQIPKVSLINETVSFESPLIFKNRKLYALNQVYVYDESEYSIIWMIQSKNYCSFETNIEESARYDPSSPIVYGSTLAGTETVIDPIKLKTDVVYHMFGRFTGFEDKYHKDPSIPVKVTFKLIRAQDGQLEVVTLPTRTNSNISFLTYPTCDYSKK